jgi:hypothetical protein
MIATKVRKCCIPSEMDGSDDSMLWNDSEEDENGSSKCKVMTVKKMRMVAASVR